MCNRAKQVAFYRNYKSWVRDELRKNEKIENMIEIQCAT